jgi:hypothetical protein
LLKKTSCMQIPNLEILFTKGHDSVETQVRVTRPGHLTISMSWNHAISSENMKLWVRDINFTQMLCQHHKGQPHFLWIGKA